MPDTISYIINIRGVDFNQHLASGDQRRAEYFEQLAPGEADYLEAHLQGDKTPIGVDLTGAWTEVGLAYPYVALLDNEPFGPAWDVRKRISEWEGHLRQRLPFTEIYRVARSLFDSWEASAGDTPIHDPKSMQLFLEWLGTQDQRYWARLPTASATAT